MLSKILSLFTGGAAKTIESIATEWIETDLETAEARSLMIKTLDPNGIMRRDLSRFACQAYGFYLVVTSVLVFVTAFGPEPSVVEGENIRTQAEIAASMMTELFLPITTAWGGIVGASFGVNGINSYKGR